MRYFVRYGEIGIKSPKIRRKFEKILMNNIRSELKCSFKNNQGRITLLTKEDDEKVRSTLSRIFGITSYSPIIETKTTKEDITNLIKEIIPKIIEQGKFNPEKDSFAIRCRRVGEHNYSSQEIAAYCGSVVVDLTNAKVNLSNPDFVLNVEVRENKTYMYHEKIRGLGGLPVGSQGKVICLMSGGIDSPVAVYQMLKRGCSVALLHCDNAPYTSGTLDKVIENTRKLQKYSAGSEVELYTIKYGDYLEYIIKEAPPRMTCVLCKSGMYQVADIVAEKIDAHAVVDGSSLGQVASQTLDNIKSSRYYCRLPIFSPLISFDKLEIEAIGQEIGTYETSIIPDGGCSAVPKYPETHSDLKLFRWTSNRINLRQKIEDTAETIEKIEF
ncbi:MAG: tRNA 4-thiouridine(8) synthase ThiI [Methanosphaera stadtmanae]|nr:tRNA 4-thiouridine(8) synthase ThiI [Methanosphaera stadtmanae]